MKHWHNINIWVGDYEYQYLVLAENELDAIQKLNKDVGIPISISIYTPDSTDEGTIVLIDGDS